MCIYIYTQYVCMYVCMYIYIYIYAWHMHICVCCVCMSLFLWSGRPCVVVTFSPLEQTATPKVCLARRRVTIHVDGKRDTARQHAEYLLVQCVRPLLVDVDGDSTTHGNGGFSQSIRGNPNNQPDDTMTILGGPIETGWTKHLFSWRHNTKYQLSWCDKMEHYQLGNAVGCA